MTTEEAKAVSAVAVTTGKALDALSGIGRYAAEVFGTVPHDLVGRFGGDWLKLRRVQNIEALERQANPYLKDIDPARISPPSPSVLIPLMQLAADEERPALQDLWARLLASAAIDGGKTVRREFFDTVSKMEPIDAQMLQALSTVGPIGLGESPTQVEVALIAQFKGELPQLDRGMSIAALQRLGCLDTHSAYWKLTSYARGLLRACQPG